MSKANDARHAKAKKYLLRKRSSKYLSIEDLSKVMLSIFTDKGTNMYASFYLG